MDPVTIGAIGLGTTLIGGVMQAKGAKDSAAAASEAYMANAATAEYRSQVAENNRVIAEQYSTYTKQLGQTGAQEKGIETAGAIGTIRAAQASSGFDVNRGSNVDVQARAAEVGTLDALHIISNAAMKAHGFDVDAANFGAEAGLYGMEASSARRAASTAKKSGSTAVATSLIGTAGSFADKWLKMSNTGVLG